MRKLLLFSLAAALAGCSGSSGGGDGGIQGRQDGGGALDGGAQFDVTALPVTAPGPNLKVAAAIAPDGRIGIVYYASLNSTDRSLEYLELETDGSTKAITLAGPGQAEGPIRRTTQLSIAFDASGTAYVGYFGKDPNFQEALYSNNPDGGGDVFWYQSDLAVASINAGGSVTHDYPIHKSTDVPRTGGIDVTAINGVVGYNPAVMVGPSQVAVVSRDLHSGQFPVQDYGDSDVEAVVGASGAWTPMMVAQGSDQGGSVGPDVTHAGLGACPSAAASSDGQYMGVVFSSETDLDGTDRYLYFNRFSGGAWSATKEIFSSQSQNASNVGGNNHGCASLAADPQLGFAVAWTNYSQNILYYSTSTDGLSWSPPEQAFGAGTGGWMPSLAIDPGLHLPVVAYYVCSLSANATTCGTSDDELRVSARKTDGRWYASTVDPEGGAFPTLLFNGGQMVVVYRDLVGGGIRIARQRAQ